MLDIGRMKIFGIPESLLEFLNREIPADANDCLASGFYEEWLAEHEPVGMAQCAGFRPPSSSAAPTRLGI